MFFEEGCKVHATDVGIFVSREGFFPIFDDHVFLRLPVRVFGLDGNGFFLAFAHAEDRVFKPGNDLLVSDLKDERLVVPVFGENACFCCGVFDVRVKYAPIFKRANVVYCDSIAGLRAIAVRIFNKERGDNKDEKNDNGDANMKRLLFRFWVHAASLRFLPKRLYAYKDLFSRCTRW